MKLIKKYPYKHYNRFSDTTGRKYLVDNIKVPSVTTILSATKDKRFLENWRRKVGDAEADRIMKQASTIGTEMHQVLEYRLNGQGYYNAMEEGTKPRMMAKTILDNINPVKGLSKEGKYRKDSRYNAFYNSLPKDKKKLVDITTAKYGNRRRKVDKVIKNKKLFMKYSSSQKQY